MGLQPLGRAQTDELYLPEVRNILFYSRIESPKEFSSSKDGYARSRTPICKNRDLRFTSAELCMISS